MAGSTDWQVPDVLSAAARELLRVRPDAYTKLTPADAGAGGSKAAVPKLTPESLFDRPVARPDDARAALAGVWLYLDLLDDSHAISQSLHSPTGSFWHAIMHRREGDFSNAKYWYARCRRHPVLDRIPALARSVAGDASSAGPLRDLFSGQWNPEAFVDVVEAVHRSPDDPLYAVAVRLQRVEWQALFDHCAKSAVGVQ